MEVEFLKDYAAYKKGDNASFSSEIVCELLKDNTVKIVDAKTKAKTPKNSEPKEQTWKQVVASIKTADSESLSQFEKEENAREKPRAAVLKAIEARKEEI